MKQCSKCKEWKEFGEFCKRIRNKDSLDSQCKECKNLYYLQNKEKIDKRRKEWHLENKNIIKPRQLKYREENKEQISKRTKSWYSENKNRILKQRNGYRNSFVLWDSDYPKNIKPYEEIRQNGEYLEVKCAYCGRWYTPTNNNISHRLSAINGNGSGECRLYCSNNCKNECPIFGQEKWPKGFKKATSREVQPELRQMVLKRDNYTCQKCEKHQDELEIGLHCHHYEGIRWNPIESADIDACITLCKKCHIEVHKLPGCGYQDMRCSK